MFANTLMSRTLHVSAVAEAYQLWSCGACTGRKQLWSNLVWGICCLQVQAQAHGGATLALDVPADSGMKV